MNDCSNRTRKTVSVGDIDLEQIIREATRRAEASGHFDRVAKQAAAQERAEAKGRRKRQLETMLFRGIPLLYARRIAEGDLRATPALDAARDWLPDSQRSLLIISGPNGCGKSLTASWLVARGANNSRFLRVAELLRASPYREEDMMPLESASVLALDDMSVEFSDKNGMLLSVVDNLAEARSGHLLKTVITTNLPSEQFCDRYQDRIADRIRDGLFVECNNESLRGAP